jgi:hypothetical protein
LRCGTSVNAEPVFFHAVSARDKEYSDRVIHINSF